MKDLKLYLQILLATAIVGGLILLAISWIVPRASAATLPTTITINGKTENYVTYRNTLIGKQMNGKLQMGSRNDERKIYRMILNLENSIKKLKGWSIQQFNQDILTRKL